MAKVTVMNLLEAGVHFGHQTRRWNPKMKPYIYNTRNGISIFDLTISIRQLAKACNFLSEVVVGGGNVLFVGSKRQAQETIRSAAERTNMFFMTDRWVGGALTNHKVVMTRVEYLKKLRTMEANGDFASMPKKEVAKLRRERSKLERNLGGIIDMTKLPAVMVVVDVMRENIAVREANKLGIPVVALVDSNCNPDPIDYIVPGNDDALRAVKVMVDAFASAIIEAQQSIGIDTSAAAVTEPVAEPAAKIEDIEAESLAAKMEDDDADQ